MKKVLYMIGNSHIDPVWLWTWEEGMQEVKATFASALERMNEYEDYIFTSTSAAFFKWIEKTVPEMFEEIKKRVAEGRWDLTGGWFIEPDCILPCGESFVRQGLYSQRYFKEKFGKACSIGSNVDSFGHGPTLPQILKKSGMESYIFMRPRLDTPLFVWESDDGSLVNAINLPAEYTTWFHGPTVKNIEQTLERTPEWPIMPCCYGVGNHGGGPTKENIESIISLKNSFPDTTLEFSIFSRFLKDLNKEKLTTIKGPFEKFNTGCYSVDSQMKKMNRMAENRLIQADAVMSMAASVKDSWMLETGKMQELWETVLFNQFHDTLGGTSIKSARDEAVLQLSSACAQAGYIKALAVQNVANSYDTRGEGFPLFLFNLSGIPYERHVTLSSSGSVRML
jgi:alpha-mannosidase